MKANTLYPKTQMVLSVLLLALLITSVRYAYVQLGTYLMMAAIFVSSELKSIIDHNRAVAMRSHINSQKLKNQ